MPEETLIQFLTRQMPELWIRVGEHLMLTGASTIMAILIGIPIALLAFRIAFLRAPLMVAVQTLQTIPSLAMLAFLLALTNKIGVTPALIALTLYGLFPIVRNTLTGIEQVPESIMEAASGIGMSQYQQLFWVRIPLAAPVIVAGIRTAAVIAVGIATLAAFIGAGGLGEFINRGLALSNTRLILLGAIPAALLAIVVDLSIGAFQWGLALSSESKSRSKAILRKLAYFVPVIFLALAFSVYFHGQSQASTGKVVRIATKHFTEQLILGELMAQLIEAKTDLSVERFFNLGGTMICHNALVKRQIDLYPEYTGTALTTILHDKVISDPNLSYRLVSEQYKKQFAIDWLTPFPFNNTWIIAVRAEDARRAGWSCLSDLKASAPNLTAGFISEFMERPDGALGLSNSYGLRFAKVVGLDPSIIYDAIAKHQVDAICATSTDGRIAAYHLIPLVDDKHFFPIYQAAPVVDGEFLRNHQGLAEVLKPLTTVLNEKNMQSLNYQVDQFKQSPAEVSRKFLQDKGLIKK